MPAGLGLAAAFFIDGKAAVRVRLRYEYLRREERNIS
jgi:hypothetical protein